MKILALEFSSPQRSVAVVDSSDAAPPRLLGEVTETDVSTNGIVLVDRLLHEGEVAREQIETIVVGLGPGSYTGVRSAIALAVGWHLGRGSCLTGLSSVDCLAAQAKHAGWRGDIHLAVDAQRNEFYLATYTLTDQQLHAKTPLHLASWDEVNVAARQGDVLLGPEMTRWFPDGKNLFPHASTSALLAAQEPGLTTMPPLEPIYLRQTAFVKATPPRTWE